MIVFRLKDFAIVTFIVIAAFLVCVLFYKIKWEINYTFDNFIVPALLVAGLITVLMRIILSIIVVSTKKYVLSEVSFTEFGLREKHDVENNLIKYKKSDLKEVIISTGDLIITIDVIFENDPPMFLVVYLPKYFIRVFGKKDIDKVVTECKLLFGKKIVKIVRED